MRILHVTPALDPAWAYGPAAQRVARLASAQAALGHDVTVLTTDALAPHERLTAGSTLLGGVRVVRVRNLSSVARTWLDLSTPFGMTSRLRALCRATPPDVVHLHHLRSVENLIAARTVLKAVPFVLSPHDTLPRPGREALVRLWDLVTRDRVMSRVDAVVDASASDWTVAAAQTVQIYDRLLATRVPARAVRGEPDRA